MRWIDRCREALGPKTVMYVRVDAAADCTAFLRAVHARGAFYLVKARTKQELLGAVYMTKRWTTVDRDADWRALREVREIRFQRNEWLALGHKVRIVADQSRERRKGPQF